PRHPVALPVEISPADTALAADDRGRMAALAPEIGEPLGDRDRPAGILVKAGQQHAPSPQPQMYPLCSRRLTSAGSPPCRRPSSPRRSSRISVVVTVAAMSGGFLDQGGVAVQVQRPALRAV